LKVLVTGGAGYLGSVLVPEMLAKGWAVTVLDSFLFQQATLLDCCRYDGFRIVRGDCRDATVLEPLIGQADVILPLAALVGAPLCDYDPTAARTVNLDAVRLLIRLASPSQRIVYPTTNSGYGIGESGKFCTEDTPLRPISLYGVTKVEAEATVLDRGNSITVRLATVFGMSSRMRLDLLVNDFVYRAVHDRAVVVFQGHFKRNFIHVRDVARVFIHALEHFDSMAGRPYNVGLEDANLSKIELCERIQRQLPKFVYLEAPIGEDPDKRDYIVSNARVASTGFRTEWPLERGITELIRGFTILKDKTFGNF
jgi:nucleoside-diphosphate-sugar epimerase